MDWSTMSTVTDDYNTSSSWPPWWSSDYNHDEDVDVDEDAPYDYPGAARITYCVVLFHLAVAGIGANLLVITVLVWTKKNRISMSSSAFLLNLVISDAAVSSAVIPLAMHGAVNERPHFSQVACQAVGFVSTLFCTSSILSVAAIAYDRYQAIINCLEYTTHSNLGYTVKGLVLIYTQAIVYSMLPLVGWGDISYLDERFMCSVNGTRTLGYAIFVFIVTCVIPTGVMTFCYVKIIRIARQHVRRITDINLQVMRTDANRRQIPTVDPRSVLGYAMVDPIQRLSIFPEIMVTQSTNEILNATARPTGGDPHTTVDGDDVSSISTMSNVGTSLKKEARATIRLLGLVLIFVVCWLPFHAVNLHIASNSRPTDSNSRILESFVFLLALSKSVLNPFFFALGSKRFRHTIKRKLRRNQKQQEQNQKLQRKRYEIAHQIASLYRASQFERTPSDEATSPSNGGNRAPKKAPGKYMYRRRLPRGVKKALPKHAQVKTSSSSHSPVKQLKPLTIVTKAAPILEESDACRPLHRPQLESTGLPYSGHFSVGEPRPVEAHVHNNNNGWVGDTLDDTRDTPGMSRTPSAKPHLPRGSSTPVLAVDGPTDMGGSVTPENSPPSGKTSLPTIAVQSTVL